MADFVVGFVAKMKPIGGELGKLIGWKLRDKRLIFKNYSMPKCGIQINLATTRVMNGRMISIRNRIEKAVRIKLESRKVR